MTRSKIFYCLPVLILLGACRSLQPVHLPGEYAFPPTDAPHWDAIAAEPSEEDWFEVLNEGSRALEWRVRLMRSASESMDLQTFLWKEDRVGLQVAREVIAAADRGVRVRLLLDDSFTIGENDLIDALNHHPNIEFRIYNPFRHRPDSVAMRQLFNLGEFSRVDHRMHNKSLIADNRVVIFGGRNLADEYFGQHHLGNFRDMEVLAGGAVVEEVSQSFDEFWNSPWSFPVEIVLKRASLEHDLAHLRAELFSRAEWREEESAEERIRAWQIVAAAAAKGQATLLSDRPAKENPSRDSEQPHRLGERLVKWMDQAERELIIVSAYLIPTDELEHALRRAEARGVNVRILTNSIQSNNHLAAHSAYRHHVRGLLDAGMQVHEVRAVAKDRGRYMESPHENKELGLHAKLMLLDDTITFMGSANLDPRSLRLNTEIGAMIESKDLNRMIRELLELDFDERNAWRLQQKDGGVVWVSDDQTRKSQPSTSVFQSLEDWFLGVLPIEGEM